MEVYTVDTTYLNKSVSMDVDDVFAELIVIQQMDMEVSSLKRIAKKRVLPSSKEGRYMWYLQTLGQNASGDTVYVRNFPPQKIRPSWIPPAADLEDKVIAP